MTIKFVCKTNYDDPCINTFTIRLKSGSRITIDRGTTVWGPNEDGTITMKWQDCYLWALDGAFFFGSETEQGLPLYDVELDEFKKLVADCEGEFDIEDEVPDDYKFELVSYEIV